MTFFSIEELNREIRRLLTEYNKLLFKRKEASRLELFQTIERGYLKPLPAEQYVYPAVMYFYSHDIVYFEYSIFWKILNDKLASCQFDGSFILWIFPILRSLSFFVFA
jgi:hypothetical protein